MYLDQTGVSGGQNTGHQCHLPALMPYVPLGLGACLGSPLAADSGVAFPYSWPKSAWFIPDSVEQISQSAPSPFRRPWITPLMVVLSSALALIGCSNSVSSTSSS